MIWLAALVIAALGGMLMVQHWSRTPHGRLKPIFAALFGLSGFLQRRLDAQQHAKLWADHDSRQRLRRDFARLMRLFARRVEYLGRIEDRTVPGPGGAIPIRIYTPRGDGPFPLVVYFHGGAWIMGGIEFTDALTRSISARAPAVVISVDYRLAPEDPFPGAINDARCVVAWARSNARGLNAEDGPLAVAGDSAGGNLAAAVALADAREGAGYVGLQVLIYPVLDLSHTATPSYLAFANGYWLRKQDMDQAIGLYVSDAGNLTHPLASPGCQEDLSGLAPALVQTAGFDVLRDEALAYVEKLKKAGVPVVHRHWPELPHGFITMTRLCREAAEATAEIADAVSFRRVDAAP